MKVPEQYGGLGLSQVYYNRALALAGSVALARSRRCCRRTSRSASPSRSWRFGSEEQKQEWLPKVATDHISAFLLTEPDVGSDPARLGTTATPTEDGTGYRINGRKLWATNGAIADVVVVMAKVPKRDGAPRRHHRVHPRPTTPRASRSRTATRSWACAASRTR